MVDRIISELFLLAWIAISFSVLYVFHRFIPRGFIIAQILFIITWGLLPDLGVIYVGLRWTPSLGQHRGKVKVESCSLPYLIRFCATDSLSWTT